MQFEMANKKDSIIKVIGVGGGGSNAVNHMYNEGIIGVDFVICNTDQQALDSSPIDNKIQLGFSLTEGRGAGSIAEVGKNSAIENLDDIKDQLQGTKMVFVTAGMGGGTGTGGAPVIAQLAKELGILTVGIVTIPFSFEGRRRKQQAEIGIEAMRKSVDTLLVISNDRLREIYGNLSIKDAFAEADNILKTAAKGIAEVITKTGQINVDFEDVKTVMHESGAAIMGQATAAGEDRAVKAVEQALASPLLNDNDIQGAKYILLNISYGSNEVLMDEISDITDFIQDEAGLGADVIWGHAYDESLGEKLNVTVIATGFNQAPETPEFAKEPEKKYIDLESDEAANIITQPISSPTQTINKFKEPELAEEKIIEEPYLKEEEIQEEPQITFDLGLSFEKEPVQGEEKKVIKYNLEDEIPTEVEVPEVTSKTIEPKTEVKIEETPAQKSIEELNTERMNRLKNLGLKLKSPTAVNELEKEPAYKRREIELNETPKSSDNNISRFTISENEHEDGERKVELKQNNSFLHDNVD